LALDKSFIKLEEAVNLEKALLITFVSYDIRFMESDKDKVMWPAEYMEENKDKIIPFLISQIKGKKPIKNLI
jgi:hypothetical protein